MTNYIPYQVYLIRVWPSRQEGTTDCRVSVESVTSGERQTFASLEGFWAFLMVQKAEWDRHQAVLLPPRPALAAPDATFTVDSTADADDANPGDGNCDDIYYFTQS